MRSLKSPERVGDLQGPIAGHERLVEVAERRQDGRHESADLATSTIVLQPLGERLGLAELLQHLPDFADQAQH